MKPHCSSNSQVSSSVRWSLSLETHSRMSTHPLMLCVPRFSSQPFPPLYSPLRSSPVSTNQCPSHPPSNPLTAFSYPYQFIPLPIQLNKNPFFTHRTRKRVNKWKWKGPWVRQSLVNVYALERGKLMWVWVWEMPVGM